MAHPGILLWVASDAASVYLVPCTWPHRPYHSAFPPNFIILVREADSKMELQAEAQDVSQGAPPGQHQRKEGGEVGGKSKAEQRGHPAVMWSERQPRPTPRECWRSNGLELSKFGFQTLPLAVAGCGLPPSWLHSQQLGRWVFPWRGSKQAQPVSTIPRTPFCSLLIPQALPSGAACTGHCTLAAWGQDLGRQLP